MNRKAAPDGRRSIPLAFANDASRRGVGKPLMFAVLALVSMLPGCAVGPDHRAPDTTMPKTWHEARTAGLVDGEAAIEQWWRVFDDQTLSSLIERAANQNLDVQMAVLRVRQARALRGVAAGELLPSLSGSASYQRQKSSANTAFGSLSGLGGTGKGKQFASTVTRGVAGSALSQGIASAVPGAAGLATPLASGLVGLIPERSGLSNTPEQNLFTSGFDASWEIDVFGGIRRNVEAADADIAVAVEDYHAVLVSLLAEVATTYVDVRALQAQIDTTVRNIKLQRETLALTKARLTYDLGSDLEVQQAETNLATTESQLPLLEAGLATSIYRLCVLLGQEPGALHEELTATGPIPQPSSETFVGVPADILRRRPDIRASERMLAAETARIGVATAELYPRFTLSGTFGFEANSFEHMVDGRSATFGLGPAVRWNIFDGLRNLNRIAAQEATAQVAYVAYEQSVLTALNEVESAMVYYKREQTRGEALSRAVAAARNAVKLSRTRYEDGLTDFQDVVDAERALVNLEMSLVQSEGQVAVNLVALYKALGGGWSAGVTAQKQYLDQPLEAIEHPLRYFFNGGKGPLPWQADAGKQTDEPSEDAERTQSNTQ